MPRPVAVRTSYRNDAAYFLRYESAIERDEEAEETWQQDVLGHLRALAQLLLAPRKKGQVDVKAG